MNLEYQFVGKRRDRIKEPGTEVVPRIGETVLFIENGEEEPYTVKHVYHIYEENEIYIQVVLQS